MAELHPASPAPRGPLPLSLLHMLLCHPLLQLNNVPPFCTCPAPSLGPVTLNALARRRFFPRLLGDFVQMPLLSKTCHSPLGPPLLLYISLEFSTHIFADSFHSSSDFPIRPMVLYPGTSWHCLETFLNVMNNRGCYRHPVSRGQGCCYTPYNTQDGPTTKNDLAPNVHRAEMEKPCHKL